MTRVPLDKRVREFSPKISCQESIDIDRAFDIHCREDFLIRLLTNFHKTLENMFLGTQTHEQKAFSKAYQVT